MEVIWSYRVLQNDQDYRSHLFSEQLSSNYIHMNIILDGDIMLSICLCQVQANQRRINTETVIKCVFLDLLKANMDNTTPFVVLY